MDERVILTGFMGVGKSAAGRALARLLGWDLVDLDQEVEREAGMPIPRIFREEKETGFRNREARALASALLRQRVVVAAGGGVLVRRENRERLAGHVVVNLTAPLDECLRRLRSSGVVRPLLSGRDPEGMARRLWEARRPLYEEVERQVDTLGKEAEAVAREIRDRFLTEAPVP